MHAVHVWVCVCMTANQSMCVAVCFLFMTFTCLDSKSMFWLALLCTSAPMCIPFMQMCLCICPFVSYVRVCLCVRVSVHRRQGLFCAVSVGSCLKQTGRVHCVPSWHAPWDNERLCFGLDCWLRIIQQHKQATVQPCVHTWSELRSKRKVRIWP